MFIVHRLDKTVLIPGGALFPVCALAYSAREFLRSTFISLHHLFTFAKQTTAMCSRSHCSRWCYRDLKLEDSISYLVSRDKSSLDRTSLDCSVLRSVGVLCWMVRSSSLSIYLFLMIYASNTLFTRRYIRRYGAHFRESTLKTIFAFSLPVIVLVIAWVPPTVLFVLGSRDFNSAVRVSIAVNELFVKWNSTWTPEKGLELDNFASLFKQGDGLGKGLLGYSEKFRIGCLYVATLLVITLIVCFLVLFPFL